MYSYYEWTVPPRAGERANPYNTGEGSVRSTTQKHERVSYKRQSREASPTIPRSGREPNGFGLYSALHKESSLPPSESDRSVKSHQDSRASFGEACVDLDSPGDWTWPVAAPSVPYYGLETAINLLASVNLADHGISDFDSSEAIEVLEIFSKPVRKFPKITVLVGPVLGYSPYVTRGSRLYGRGRRDGLSNELRKRKQPFHYFEREYTDSDQRIIQDAQSTYTPPKTKEFSRLSDRGVEFWGRRKLAAWKKNRGRQKEWRRCGFLKATTGGFRGAEVLRSKLGIETHRKLSHDMPINVLRQKPGFKRRWSRRKPNVSDGRDPGLLRYFVESALRDSDRGDTNEGVEDSLEDLMPEPSGWHDPVQITSSQAPGGSERIVLPYENFIGVTLGSSFRLLGFLRSENHGDVYAAENLFLTSNRYEVKAYILHGVSPKIREYRRRNLKKISDKPSFVCSVNQFGRRFAITRLEDQLERSSSGAPPALKKRSIGRRIFIMELEEGRPGSSTLSSKLSSTSRGSNLGAIGRRKTREFDEAFPELPKPVQVTESISIRVGADRLLAAVESHWIVRGEPPAAISELPASVIQEYATALLNSASTLQTYASVLQKIIPTDRDKTKKGKKLKTPQQIERDRTRQRESRIRKRAQKRASSAVENSALNEPDEPSHPPRLVPHSL